MWEIWYCTVGQAIDDNPERFACWKDKATHTHTQTQTHYTTHTHTTHKHTHYTTHTHTHTTHTHHTHTHTQTIHRTTQQFGSVRVVPRLWGFYPGICLTTACWLLCVKFDKATLNVTQLPIRFAWKSVRYGHTALSNTAMNSCFVPYILHQNLIKLANKMRAAFLWASWRSALERPFVRPSVRPTVRPSVKPKWNHRWSRVTLWKYRTPRWSVCTACQRTELTVLLSCAIASALEVA